jgi:hypothetical protein
MKKPDFETMIIGLRAEMSAAEIARRARLSRAYVHRLLVGDVRRPSWVQRSLGPTTRKG